MKSKVIFSTALFMMATIMVNAQNLKKQKKYLPSEIVKMKIFMGTPKTEFLERCPQCEVIGEEESFRERYIVNFDDGDYESIVFYVSKPKGEVYEMLFITREGKDVNALAKDLLGDPITDDGEWRFPPSQTKQEFNIAAWIYKNKLIYAGALKGSEWEPGFNQF